MRCGGGGGVEARPAQWLDGRRRSSSLHPHPNHTPPSTHMRFAYTKNPISYIAIHHHRILLTGCRWVDGWMDGWSTWPCARRSASEPGWAYHFPPLPRPASFSGGSIQLERCCCAHQYRLAHAHSLLDGNISYLPCPRRDRERSGGGERSTTGINPSLCVPIAARTGFWVRPTLADCIRLPDGGEGRAGVDRHGEFP